MLGWPSAPPESASAASVHAKVPIVSFSVMLSPANPAVFAVTVTVAPLDVAVTTANVAVVRLMAAARLAASVVVSVEVAKFWPVFVPLVPLRSVPLDHENPVKPLDRLMLFPADPAVEAVTVTVVVLVVAVASVLAELLLITVAILLAN